MTISRDAVLWGFRFFLRREPGSEEAIEAHMRLANTAQLAETLLKSREFDIGKPFGRLLTVNHVSDRSVSSSRTGKAPPLRILVLGNCQAAGMASLFQAMVGHAVATPLELSSTTVAQIRSGEIDLERMNAETDLVFMHPHTEALELIEQKNIALRRKLKLIPPLNFSAFHPDLVYIRDDRQQPIRGPLGEYQSSLAFYGWRKGLTLEATIALFRQDVYRHLGFFDHEAVSRQFLAAVGDLTGIRVDRMVDRWAAQGCWMYSVNHPKLFALADLARAILEREGIATQRDAAQYVPDALMSGPAWPVYPEIAKRWGLQGSYLFKKSEAECSSDMPVGMLELAEFVEASFELFSQHEKTGLSCDRLDSPSYRSLDQFLGGSRTAIADEVAAADPGPAPAPPPSSANPYQGLPDHQFWRRGVERVPMASVDPVRHTGYRLTPNDRIATAGSCFAQHISRTLQANGFNYYVAESGTDAADGRPDRNFGVFSARYGNIYTARQLLQLFDRAYGKFEPKEHCWLREDGRLVDPFRPQIEPDGFGSLEELQGSRAAHYACVRAMFESLDVLVFTLGLTEAWRSKQDGAVFPLAPGVAGGEMDPQLHEFVNFGVADVVSDLDEFVGRLTSVNPRARMIMTVSPVPLIATYEDRHVLVSTTYSKSVLRAAAEEICKRHALCTYFPSYEVITGNYNRGAYFENDLRSVKPEGVNHVMRLFTSHFFGMTQTVEAQKQALMAESERVSAVICDEEALDRAPPPYSRTKSPLRRVVGKLKSLTGRPRNH